MAFNPQEQNIIQWGVANGKTKEDVTKAISNYRSGIVPEKAAPAKAEPSLGQRVSTDVQKAGSGVNDAITGSGKYEGQTAVERGFGATSEAFGAIPAVASEVLPKPAREVLGKVGEVAGGVVNWLGEKLGNTQLAQDFVTKHPDAAKTLERAANIGQSAGNISSNILLAEGASKGIEAGTNVAKKVGSKIPGAVADAGEKISNTAGAVKNKIPGLKSMTPEEIAAKDLRSSIEATMPYQSKEVRIEQLRSSAPEGESVQRKGILQKSVVEPNEGDTQRGTIANEYIKGQSDPLMQINKIKKGLVEKSNQVNEFLDKNPTQANFEDMRNYLEKNKPKSSLQKNPAVSEAYNNATEGAIDTLYKTMKSSAKKSGDFNSQTSGAPIRQARIAIDEQIAKELGEETFDSPQYKGIRAAAIDIRNLINRMNEDLLRYPGQMEKLNRMNDFINETRSRGIEIDPSNPETRAKLEGQFDLNLDKTPESEANAKALADQHKIMERLYEARDNIIDRYQKNLGKDKLQEFFQTRAGKMTKSSLRAIGGGGVTSLITGIH